MILWRNNEDYHFFIILIPTPDFSLFYYMLGGNLGSLLYGDVSVMKLTIEYEIRHETSTVLQLTGGGFDPGLL